MDDEKLIEAVRAREFIYTKSAKNHFNRDLLCFAWESIAGEVGSDVTSAACRNRWASLRDHFRKKYKELTTQSGHAGKKKRKWYLYDYLTFLIPSSSSDATTRSTRDNFKSETLDADEDMSTLSTDDEATQSHSPLSVQSTEETETTKQVYPSNKTRRSCKRNTCSLSMDREVLQALSAPEKEVDDNEMFFKSLLPAMRTLDTVETLQLRSEIQTLVLTHVKAKASKTSNRMTMTEES